MEEEDDCYCWACGKRIHYKHEKVQSVCDNCKASIFRKHHKNSNIKEFISEKRKKSTH